MATILGFSVIFGVTVFAVAALVTRRDRRRAELRRQVVRLRNEREALMRLCLDHMDVEPFARLVWDQLASNNTHPLEGPK